MVKCFLAQVKVKEISSQYYVLPDFQRGLSVVLDLLEKSMIHVKHQ
jgi:hypothetical protein